MCLFIRDLTSSESRKLSRWLRSSRNGVQMLRAQILSFSGQGMRVQEISSHLEMNEEYLRELIRRFNDEGFDALRQKTRSGRPPKLTEEEESIIAEIATAPPQAMGRPFNQWSLKKLRDFLVERKMIQPVGHNVIRRVLIRIERLLINELGRGSDRLTPNMTLKKTHQTALQEGADRVLRHLLRRFWTC